MRRWASLFVIGCVAACGAFSGTDSAPAAIADGGSIEGRGADSGSPADGSGGGAEGGHVALDSGSGAFSDDGGVPIDCSMVPLFVFCNDFDGHAGESSYTTNNSSFDAGVSSGHYVSASGALLMVGTGYAVFASSSTLTNWTVSFDVRLDSPTPAGEAFANITKSGEMAFSWSPAGILVDGTAMFAVGSGWHHVVVTQSTGAATANVSVDGITKAVAFAATNSTLTLKLGNLTGSGPIWFDDVLATTQ